MKKIGLLLSLWAASFFLVEAKTIDTEKSVVNFKIGNMKIRTVDGTFGGMKGDLKFDVNDLADSYFKVSIDAGSVNTENTKRDDHLRNKDFFHVDLYPHITFTSQSIEITSDGFVTKGTMDMHGVQKQVEIPFTFENNTFVGKIVVNRFDYNVGENIKTGMVSSEAQLEIVCVLK